MFLVFLEYFSFSKYLQRHRRVHGDLKSLNILIDEDWIAQVADFGESYILSDLDKAEPHGNVRHGTAAWMAPELLRRGESSLKIDVYSYGIVLWELLVWKYPFVLISAAEENDPVAYQRRKQLVQKKF